MEPVCHLVFRGSFVLSLGNSVCVCVLKVVRISLRNAHIVFCLTHVRQLFSYCYSNYRARQIAIFFYIFILIEL